MSTWKNNQIQFPRLLAEVLATHDIDYSALAESMSLEPSDVRELFVRATKAWENINDPESPVRYGTLPEDDQFVVDSDVLVHHESYATMTEVESGDEWILSWYRPPERKSRTPPRSDGRAVLTLVADNT